MAPIPENLYLSKLYWEVRSEGFWRDGFAEMMATFLYMCGQIAILQTWGDGHPAGLAVQAGIGSAFLWIAVKYGLGDYGGSHMNPAITLSMMIRAEISILKGIFYWTMQLGGAICASFLAYAFTPTNKRGNLGNTHLDPEVKWWQGLLIEMWITLIVCVVALATNSSHRKGTIILPSLPLGFAIGHGTLIAYSSTRASMNPARSVGPAVVISALEDTGDIWEHHWVYWAGPFLGALLAGFLFWILENTELSGSHDDSPQYNRNNHRNRDRCVYTTDQAHKQLSSFDSPVHKQSSSFDSPVHRQSSSFDSPVHRQSSSFDGPVHRQSSSFNSPVHRQSSSFDSESGLGMVDSGHY